MGAGNEKRRPTLSADETRIREVLSEHEAGYRTKDADQIVGHYAPEIVLFDLAPPLRRRRGQPADIGGGRLVDMTTADGVRTWLTGFGDAPFDYETRDLELAVGGEVAYAYCLSRMGSPGAFSLWFRTTFGLRKNAGDWWITHIHASTPFYMDETSKAALDLAP
jgi:ketosteroid isomerase-like protein